MPSSSSSSSTRWCPTREQLMILEELYRRGLKTPNASEIQRITAHLSLYGKIQGKNVFYWFQNHKARDRQKLRKKLLQLHPQLLHHNQLYQYNNQLGPPTYHFQPPCSFTTLNLINPQGGETWRAEDLPMKSCGHDSMMIIEAGPTFPCYRSKPLETLELFPLSSSPPSLSL